ncbi:hypothetical protein RFI_06781 [Reticulomyxa filosa]|uniref:Uncharacterized protein n=1 Tax=Reticulomyxa filosa TaxID=46433 RepID=X6NWY5_RETFI|nr:hypothetical protein RFI_06781 [Reticulomyxa filosa]|eukprot:ETO30339.1 hypothetical protein RFI_06781 [Reticulomyxa filosa]
MDYYAMKKKKKKLYTHTSDDLEMAAQLRPKLSGGNNNNNNSNNNNSNTNNTNGTNGNALQLITVTRNYPLELKDRTKDNTPHSIVIRKDVGKESSMTGVHMGSQGHVAGNGVDYEMFTTKRRYSTEWSRQNNQHKRTLETGGRGKRITNQMTPRDHMQSTDLSLKKQRPSIRQHKDRGLNNYSFVNEGGMWYRDGTQDDMMFKQMDAEDDVPRRDSKTVTLVNMSHSNTMRFDKNSRKRTIGRKGILIDK